ncbi:MAG TPA: holo-ACP synthase [Burkholderiaceae bacterium]|nr:holo-ACP synthase [Burkholderiaceae bacterium]
MIVGIGTDIIEIGRIAAACERHGDRFAERILGPQELRKYHVRRGRSEARGIAFLATRFAAKEAFSKAIGLGLRSPMRWRAIEMLNEPSGRPMLIPHGELASWMAARGWSAQVSVSDERLFAVAFVLVSNNMPNHGSDDTYSFFTT